MALLVSAIPLEADPPWAVESPAAAEARFGLGLDALFEHQESLRIDSQESVVSLTTEDGGSLTDVVDGDPDLLNRKFDLEWELKGPGVDVPLALPSFRLTDLIEVFPTLTLEAASVDVTLDSISKTESNPKVSLAGRGSLFGVKLGAITSLCNSCPWFNGTSYHYRSLPAFEANRSPAFAEPGFEVLRDEVRLSQEVHELSTKFGYIAPSKRIAYYIGVRARWTDVEIEDELRLANVDSRQEMGLSSRTKLKSETIEAVAGVDARLGGRFFARTETAYSGQDYGVLVAIVYVWPQLRETQEARKKKAKEIAGVIAPQLARVLAKFREARRNLPVETLATGKKVYSREAVSSLLNDTERDLLEALSGSELTAMRDYIKDLFRNARMSLGLLPAPQATLKFFSNFAPVKLASLSALRPALLQRPQPDAAYLDQRAIDSWLDRIGGAIGRILTYSENEDLLVDLCVKSIPEEGARFRMRPISYTPPDFQKAKTNGRVSGVWRGIYGYTVSRTGFKTIQDTLNLVDQSGPVLACELIANSSPEAPPFCQLQTGRIEQECPE